MKVYILMGVVAYEGTDILEVFAKEEAAQAALKPLVLWTEATPEKQDWESYHAHEAACPRKGCEGYDRFHVSTHEVTE